MTNSFSTNKEAQGIIVEGAAQRLSDKVQFCKNIGKIDADEYKGKNGFNAGDVLNVSKPARFIPQNTMDITSSIQAVVEETVPLTLDVIATIGLELDTSEEVTDLSLQRMADRVIAPAIDAIALNVEEKFLEKAMKATYNLVGTAGSETYDVSTILAAKDKLNQYLAPKDEKRNLLLDTQAGSAAVLARKGLFNAQGELSKQYKRGYIGQADGFTWMENELLYSHTNGTDVSFEVSTTVSVEGQSTLVVEGLTNTTGTVTAGTSFTIDGVFAVHPVTKKVYPFLQAFVATATATANGSGVATVAVSPSFNTVAAGNGLQNIDAFPVDGATCNVLTGAATTDYTHGLAFHKSAFRMISPKLMVPEGVSIGASKTVQGITVRMVQDWDQLKGRMVTRLDFLGGLVADRPEFACRITS